MTNEEVINFYRQKTAALNQELKKLKLTKSSFGWLRLGTIAAVFLAFYLLWQAGAVYVSTATVVLISVFLYLVKKDLQNQKKIQFCDRLTDLYQKEIDALNGKFPFEEGNRYIDKDHPYTSDLDIFGKKSLFHYLNRTQTEPGSDKLAGLLREKSRLADITDRQTALKELAADPGWLKRLHATQSLQNFTSISEKKLTQWISGQNVFLPFKSWAWLRYLLPMISVGTTILYFFDVVGLSFFLIVLFLMAVVSWQINKFVAPIHRQLDDISRQSAALSDVAKMIEDRSFQTSFLKRLQQTLFVSDTRASAEINKIKRLLDNLDIRYNMLLSFPLNLLFLWNLQQVLGLERWKQQNKDRLNQWVDTISEMDALGSLGIFTFNHPEYVFPDISNDYFHLSGSDVGHPLIPSDKRVSNDVTISARGELMLVTGSNMAGKSTYLRSVGVNCVLAFCGAPVCATAFSVSLVSLVSSMRIVDDLQESTSTFYAELKKLKTIIDRVNRQERVLILLDEILRGTNSLDRHTGSKALIRQLIEQESAGIIATHDLELANLNDGFAQHIKNYHFDVRVTNEELFFDYKLQPGICRSMNASILMKKIGIEI